MQNRPQIAITNLMFSHEALKHTAITLNIPQSGETVTLQSRYMIILHSDVCVVRYARLKQLHSK